MFEVEINGKKHKAAVSCLTPYIYELEFGGDMLADLFGRIDKKSSEFVEFDKKGGIVAIDYTAVKWNTLLKILWSSLKTVNDALPGFNVWAKDAEGISIVETRMTLEKAITDCFFRSEPDGDEAGEQEEAE